MVGSLVEFVLTFPFSTVRSLAVAHNAPQIAAWSSPGLAFTDGSFQNRTQAFFAGTLISAIANLLLISILGLHDEKEGDRKEEYHGAYTTTTAPTAAPPTARAAETEGYHRGHPGEAGSPPQVTSRTPPV